MMLHRTDDLDSGITLGPPGHPSAAASMCMWSMHVVNPCPADSCYPLPTPQATLTASSQPCGAKDCITG